MKKQSISIIFLLGLFMFLILISGSKSNSIAVKLPGDTEEFASFIRETKIMDVSIDQYETAQGGILFCKPGTKQICGMSNVKINVSEVNAAKQKSCSVIYSKKVATTKEMERIAETALEFLIQIYGDDFRGYKCESISPSTEMNTYTVLFIKYVEEFRTADRVSVRFENGGQTIRSFIAYEFRDYNEIHPEAKDVEAAYERLTTHLNRTKGEGMWELMNKDLAYDKDGRLCGRYDVVYHLDTDSEIRTRDFFYEPI